MAIGQKDLSIAASIAVMVFENDGYATIDTGAQVNQNTAYRRAAPTYTTSTPGLVAVAPNDIVLVEPGHTAGGIVGTEYQYLGTSTAPIDLATTNFTDTSLWTAVAQQDVLIQGVNENDNFHLGGNFQPLGYGNLPSFAIANKKLQVTGPKLIGSGGSTTGKAAGVDVQISITNATTEAQIQDGVSLYADDLGVQATNSTLAANVGVSGGKSGDAGLNGVVVYNRANDTTIASVGAGANVSVGSAACDLARRHECVHGSHRA